jgi:hypothetical protein
MEEVEKFIQENGTSLITPKDDGSFECEAGYEIDIEYVAAHAQLEPYKDKKSIGLVMPEMSGDKYLAYVGYNAAKEEKAVEKI